MNKANYVIVSPKQYDILRKEQHKSELALELKVEIMLEVEVRGIKRLLPVVVDSYIAENRCLIVCDSQVWNIELNAKT